MYRFHSIIRAPFSLTIRAILTSIKTLRKCRHVMSSKPKKGYPLDSIIFVCVRVYIVTIHGGNGTVTISTFFNIS